MRHATALTASPRRARGAVLMGFVVLLALGGLLVVNVAESAAVTRQRQAELQLLWVGQQYRQALESYYLATPGPHKHLPVTLEHLLRDDRFPQPVRHLRRLYADPMQPEVPLALMRQGGQIIGVHSQSDAQTLRRSGFAPGLEAFEGAQRYSDWRFVFLPRRPVSPATPGRLSRTFDRDPIASS